MDSVEHTDGMSVGEISRDQGSPQNLKSIRLDELERVMWLRLDIHPNHVKPRTVIANRSPTSTAEQVKKKWAH